MKPYKYNRKLGGDIVSLTPRFTAIDKAVLVATGNSFVVCGSTTATGSNTSDMIKPDGSTTRDWS